MNARKTLVIYHGNCADGFGAAWAVRRAIPDAEFVAGHYGHPPPDVSGCDVVIVDFSYKRDVLLAMAKEAHSILVLDHHASAERDLDSDNIRNETLGQMIVRIDKWKIPFDVNHWQQLINKAPTGLVDVHVFFDNKRSGAGIAWDFFHPHQPRPQLINHIEDRDLWKFAYPMTREIQSALFSFPYDFLVWDALMVMDLNILRSDGSAIERKHKKDVRELVDAYKRRMVIDGVEVWAANLPHIFTSDAGNIMSEGQPFAACYWDTAEARTFSLRSQPEGADVSRIAEKFGGGGHKNAAGFRLPHGVDPAAAP